MYHSGLGPLLCLHPRPQKSQLVMKADDHQILISDISFFSELQAYILNRLFKITTLTTQTQYVQNQTSTFPYRMCFSNIFSISVQKLYFFSFSCSVQKFQIYYFFKSQLLFLISAHPVGSMVKIYPNVNILFIPLLPL